MVTFLKNFRRSDGAAASPNGDAHTSAAEMEQMQTMVANAMTAVEQLRSLAPVVESAAAMTALAERLQALEGQVTAMERLGGLLEQLEDQADRAAKTQVRIDAQMNNTVKSVERAETQAATLSHQLDLVTTLRNELRSLVEEGGLDNLRAEAGEVRGSVAELSEAVTRVRAQYDDMFRSQRHAASRIEAMDRQYQESAGRVADMEGRVEQATGILEQINQAVDGIPGVQHQLSVVKAVADQLSQRAAALEQQREAIDRASAQVSRFSELEKLIDGGLRRQEDQVRALAEVEGQLNEIQTFQATVVSRAEAIRNEQDELEAVAGMARGALAELREELTRSTEQVELEHRGLEAARERVADLRDVLRQCEERLATLETSRQGLESVQAQAEELAGKLAGLADGLGRTTEQAIRLRNFGDTAEQLDRRVQDVAGRLQRAEEVKDTVDAVVRDFRTLDGTHEAIRDGLEQMRVAYDEMSRQRESLAETEAWLANSDVWVRSLRHQVAELSGMQTGVEQLRVEVERVQGACEAIDSRRPMVEEVQQRLGELAGLTAQLGERGEGLRNRMDVAEGRFTDLAARAEEARRVSEQIGGVVTAVVEAGRRSADVSARLGAMEERAQQLDGIGDRVRVLANELEQRQGALDKATEHLQRASGLRQEAADATRQLELLLQQLRETLGSAEERGAELTRTTESLEERAEGLGVVERRIAELDDILANVDAAQTEASRTFEQLVGRQSSLDALQAEVKHVFDLGERAVDDVRRISEARREVEETRSLIERTQDQLRETSRLAMGLEDRRRQLERTEQRLARADALAIDVRGTLESLQAQKAVVDQVVEQAGALAFQMKQAEALTAMLRQERTLAGQIRDAVGRVRQDEPVEHGNGSRAEKAEEAATP